MRTRFGSRFFLFCVALLFAPALPAAAHLEKVNLGLYGGYVADAVAIENASGDTEVLIAVDSSQRGVFKWSESGGFWSSLTYPIVTPTAEIPGVASQVEGNPASPTDVYAVLSSETDKSALYVSDTYGDTSSGAVSFTAAMTDTGSHLDDVNALVGSDSGIYAGTAMGAVWLNTGSASDTFTSVFDESAAGRVLSLTVTGASSGYVLMEDSVGTLSLWVTNWSGSNTDISSMLPTVAPVEAHTGGCPIDDCDLDIHRVAADPADITGQTLYIAGSSINGMAFVSIDGGATWNDGWDYQCSRSGSGCESFGLTRGYPSVILFQDTAASGTESRFVYISTVVRDNDATTPTWDVIPNLSSTITPSGSSGPVVMDFTTHPNDSALAIDPNDGTILYVATDLAIGQITHDPTTGFPTPSGEEMGNAKGIEGVVINDMDFFENSATDKDLWIATKSGLGKGLNFDPTDPTSTEDAGDWVYPIFPLDDGSPPTAVAINPEDNAIVLAGNGKIYRNEESTTLPEAAQNWTLTFDPSNFAGPGEPLESDRSDRTKTTAIEYQQQGSCDRVYMTAANEDTGLEGGVFYSDDTGQNWTIDDYNTAGLLKMPVNTLWTSQYTVWIGVGDKSVETPRSFDTGIKARLSLCSGSSFWTPSCSSDPVTTQMQSEIIVAIDGVSISGDHTVYIASEDTIYQGLLPSGTSGSGFCDWGFTVVTPPTGSDFTSVAVDTADADHVWASFGNCIQESTDGGLNWADYSDSCEPEHEFIRKLVFDDLLVGTQDGLFAYAVPEPSAAVLGWAALGTLLSIARRRKCRTTQ